MNYNWAIFILLGIPFLTQAGTVYKCNNKGATVYQSKPCPGATVDANFQREQRIQNQSNSAYQQRTTNGTSNEIAETAEGKKRSLAIAQEAYRITKER